MRFLGRTASERPLATTPHDASQLADIGLPLKAEALLGTKTSSSRKKSEKRTGQPQAFERVPNEDQKHLGKVLQAQEALLDKQQALLDNMPSNEHKGPRLQMWPNTERYNRSANDLLTPSVYQPSRRPGIPPRRTSTNAVHDHYDPSKQPLHVSQQTSASAVRDMGLRKGSPMMHETSSDTSLANWPLKPSMKKSPESKRHPDNLLKLRTNSSEKKPRRLDLSHFFPRPKAQPGPLLSPNKLSRSPSALTDMSDFFPPETVQVQLKRPAGNSRFETQKTMKTPSADSGSITRTKVFEPDVFDQAKTHVRRPPKGIQNWFDGFEISSDEEEKLQEPELEPEHVELPTDALSSVSSPWVLKPDSEQPTFDRKASLDPVEDNLLAIEAAKERMRTVGQRKGSTDSGTIASVVSSEPGRKPPSRLATSRLASESVLSLSDSDGEERVVRLPTIRGSVEHVNPLDQNAPLSTVDHPTGAPRKSQSKRSIPRESLPRQSTSTVQTCQTSGSIPIRLTDSIPLPGAMFSSPPQIRHNTQSSSKDGAAQALWKLEGMRDSKSEPSRSRPTTKASVQDVESNATGETSGSLLSDASHMMAVTEEEMILLEMMRNKRAAMQKNSFTEGYQLALKREQEHLERRRESARQTALKILRAKDEKEKSQRSSRIAEGVEPLENLIEQQRRKYSAIRKEDVDKALKVKTFLASAVTPTAESFPEPPSRTTSYSETLASQKVELLLPKTYSPAPSKTHTPDGISPVSAGDTSSVLEDDDIETHHRTIRQFLAASGTFEGSSLFPTPPSVRSKPSSWRDKRRSIITPSPVAEEEPIPNDPERSPHCSSISPEQQRETRRSSTSGRRLSIQLDLDFVSETASARPAPLRQASKESHPYRLNPNLDFPALDFPSSMSINSPSLSTSRASPLTPVFPTAPSSDRPTIEGASSSDNERSIRGRAYTPDTDLTSLSAATPKKRRPAKKVPPKLNPVVGQGLQPRGSITSITSAGDDVLAAWAELGGRTETFATRRRVR